MDHWIMVLSPWICLLIIKWIYDLYQLCIYKYYELKRKIRKKRQNKKHIDDKDKST